MSQLTMFEDTPKPISSPGSAAGPTPSDSRNGPTTGPSGPVPVPASPSAWRARARAKTTPGTSGPSSFASSGTDDLQRSLASRLRARMGAFGSPEYVLTWREWDIGSGPPICALRALGRRTSDSGSTGWPTARAEDSESTGAHRGAPDTLTSAARLVGWPTPAVTNAERGGMLERTQGARRNLQDFALTAGWLTPTVSEADRGRMPNDGKRGAGLIEAMTGWATPAARDWRSDSGSEEWVKSRTARSKGNPLSFQVLAVAGWATPNATDCEAAVGPSQTSLTNQVTGRYQAPSYAQTASPVVYRLNPLFPLWLMGFPPSAWAFCAEPETPLFPRSLPNL